MSVLDELGNVNNIKCTIVILLGVHLDIVEFFFFLQIIYIYIYFVANNPVFSFL